MLLRGERSGRFAPGRFPYVLLAIRFRATERADLFVWIFVPHDASMLVLLLSATSPPTAGETKLDTLSTFTPVNKYVAQLVPSAYRVNISFFQEEFFYLDACK